LLVDRWTEPATKRQRLSGIAPEAVHRTACFAAQVEGMGLPLDDLRRKTAMALFRVSKPQEPKPESPAQLFRDLPKDSSTIKFLWGHQETLLDKYDQAQ
jgi:hypothetical protein